MNLNFFKKSNVILNYHRIFPDNDSYKPNDELIVSVKKFKEQLIFLKKNYNIVSLDEILNFEKSNKLKVCITFDDGYRDNLIHALPILNDLNVPATIYVITRFLEGEFNIWWYELEDYIWQNHKNIKFEFNKKKYDFSINNDKEKTKCFEKLNQIIKNLSVVERNNFLKELTQTENRKQYKEKLLSKDDLIFLSSNPLITIGAHSHNHLSLKNLEHDECINEIKMSKRVLESTISREIKHFSYPYGSKKDAGKREFKAVRDLGFKSAVTTTIGKLSEKRLFNLPRIHMNQKTNEKILKFKLSNKYYLYRKVKEFIN